LREGFSLPCHYLVKISPGKLVAEDTPEAQPEERRKAKAHSKRCNTLRRKVWRRARAMMHQLGIIEFTSRLLDMKA
jgi:hypothetical protein